MAAKHHILRTAAVGLATVAVTATASVAAHAASDEESGHLTCPAGTQVRVWSLAGGDEVTHYWYSDNGKHGADVREIVGFGAVDSQTFTLERDVYWRVVAEGTRPNVEAGAECHYAS
ncbi:MAG TPA: hypothetical protein VK053_18320 [Jiangellaceae bacterium]|nr:hypothetical protein [Jiangellaceae bacterium]